MAKQYAEQKHERMLDLISQEYGIDYDDLREFVFINFPEIDEKEKCANCGKSMGINKYSFSNVNARLLMAMGEVVRHKRFGKGMAFDESNQVHIETEVDSGSYQVKSSMTQLRYLGLIAKIKDEHGVHQTDKGWLITKRGWSALRDEEVQRWVTAFNNKIVDRSEEKITISQALKDYPRKYDPTYWYEIESYQQGKLL